MNPFVLPTLQDAERGTVPSRYTGGVAGRRRPVIQDDPEIYSEYAPYVYVEDMKNFIDWMSQLNRVAWA